MTTNKHIVLLLFAISCSLSTECLSQSKAKWTRKTPSLGVWRQYRNDTLRLLWIPRRASDWLKYNKSGYRVERAEWLAGKIKVYVPLTQAPIKPLAEKNWKPNSPESKLAKEAIYAAPANNPTDYNGEKQANEQNLNLLLVTMTAFKDHNVAQKMGLTFADASLERNKRYVYRIFPEHQKNEKVDTTYIEVKTDKPTAILSPPVIKIESLEKAVMLSWPATKYLSSFVMYHVERSADGETYERITKSPYFHGDNRIKDSFLKDSIGYNYRPYIYRLVGLTHFGQWVTSPMIAVGMGKDFTPPAQPVIESAKHVGGTNVTIKWAQKPEDDLRGFWVSRGSSLKGEFKRLTVVPLDKNETTFTDFKAEAQGTNHYIVFAVDTAGNERASLPAYVTMTDTIPPAPPKGIIASSDSKGHVTLYWNKNREKDLKGYYVYFANDPDHEFSQITKVMLTDTVFRDTITLKSLTKRVFYKVVSMDEHFNHSPFSSMASVKRPDIIPPIVPLITHVTVKDSTATLQWQSSPSNDVVEYRLYRREQGKEWEIAKVYKEAEIMQRSFVDNLRTERTYEYAIEVTDDGGLKSERSPIRTAKALRPLLLAEAPQPTVTYIEESKKNRISWKYTAQGSCQYLIYRSKTKGPLTLVGVVRDAQINFIYDKPTDGKAFAYQIKAVYTDGRQTKLSERAEVK